MLRELRIGDMVAKLPIIQGGMVSESVHLVYREPDP